MAYQPVTKIRLYNLIIPKQVLRTLDLETKFISIQVEKAGAIISEITVSDLEVIGLELANANAISLGYYEKGDNLIIRYRTVNGDGQYSDWVQINKDVQFTRERPYFDNVTTFVKVSKTREGNSLQFLIDPSHIGIGTNGCRFQWCVSENDYNNDYSTIETDDNVFVVTDTKKFEYTITRNSYFYVRLIDEAGDKSDWYYLADVVDSSQIYEAITTLATSTQLDAVNTLAQQGLDTASLAIKIATHPVNIPNGNFENDLDGWTVDDASHCSLNLNQSIKYSGYQSCEIVNTDSSNLANSGWHGAHQNNIFAPIPGHVYKVRARVRAENPTTNADVRLIVEEYDSTPAYITNFTKQISGVNDKWVVIETDEFKASNNVSYWNIKIECLGSSVSGDSVYVDYVEYLDISDSSKALTILNAMADDSQLTLQERIKLRTTRDEINIEATELITVAGSLGLNYNAYSTAKDNLIAFLENDCQIDSTSQDPVGINKSDYQTFFSNYFNARDSLSSAISTELQDRADTALGDIADISSDSVLTDDEKIRLRLERDKIDKEYSEISGQATTYSVDDTNYYNAYVDLKTYLETTCDIDTAGKATFASLGTDRATFNTKFATYVTEREKVKKLIEKAIEDGAKDYADTPNRITVPAPYNVSSTLTTIELY